MSLLNLISFVASIWLLFDFVAAVRVIPEQYQCQGPARFDATFPGTLQSPYYGKRPYHNNLWCEYIIRTHQGYRIKLTFEDFDVEVAGGCRKDYLAVFSKNRKTMMYTLCGSELPKPILSLEGDDEIRLILISDGMIGKKGFSIHYEASPHFTSVCEKGLTECRNRNCFKSEQKCDGVDDCGDATDEEDCGNPIVTQPEKCGVQEIEPNASKEDYDRIVGGQEAIPNSWPWQVSLQFPTVEPSGHFCGGTLINEQWVLTAIHCVSGAPYPGSVRIHVGAHDLLNKTEYEQVRIAKKIIGYPDLENDDIFKKGSMLHDMALIKLNAPVKFNKGVQPACIPEPNWIPQPEWQCYSTGWGETRGSGSANRLKQLDMKVRARRICGYYEESQICVGNPPQSTCHGDSGSPLNCRKGGKWYSFGALSLLIPTNYETGLCSGPNSVTLYSSTVFKTEWIRDTINKHS